MRFLCLLLLPSCSLIDAARGPGAGGYEQANIGAGGPAPVMAIPANLDGNSSLDVVVLGDTGPLLAINDTTGHFTDTMSLDIPETIDLIAAADLDEDADALDEVIVAKQGSLRVFKSVGVPQSWIPHTVGPVESATPNIVTTGRFPMIDSGRSIVVSYTSSPGTFRVIPQPLAQEMPPKVVNVGGLIGAGEIAVADFRTVRPGDELVFTDVQVTEAFTDAPDVFMLETNDFEARQLTAGKFISEGFNDIAFSRPDGSEHPIVMLPGGVAGVPDDLSMALELGTGRVRDLLTCDVDGDERDDLVALDMDSPTLHVFETRKDVPPVEVEIALRGTPTHVACADFNGDGRFDFLVSPGEGGGVDLLLSQ